MSQYYVYIMTNRSRTLYTGVANNLMRRMYEHKQQLVEGFTKKYNITILVYYEVTTNVQSAIAREKQIKGWLRSKKIALIESMNPQWKDLSEEFETTPPINRGQGDNQYCHSDPFALCHSDPERSEGEESPPTPPLP